MWVEASDQVTLRTLQASDQAGGPQQHHKQQLLAGSLSRCTPFIHEHSLGSADLHTHPMTDNHLG